MSKITKAISIRAPWWWYIFRAGKDVENRSWRTNFRGRIYIHASRWWSDRELDEGDWPVVFSQKDLDRMKPRGGHIVGSVEIVDCIDDSKSKWAQDGFWHFVLRDPKPLRTPVPVIGKVGIFNVEGSL